MIVKLLHEIIYCHGLNSSAQSETVTKLRETGLNVFTWDIDPDPDIGLPNLIEQVDDWLMDRLNQCNTRVTFVGESLGAWYAAKLAHMFGANSVLINPACSPSRLLPNAGVSQAIASKYEGIDLQPSDTIFVADNDQWIDLSGLEFGQAKTIFRAITYKYKNHETTLQAAIDHLNIKYVKYESTD